MKRALLTNMIRWLTAQNTRLQSPRITILVVMTIVGVAATVGFAISASPRVTRVETLKQPSPVPTDAARVDRARLNTLVAFAEVRESAKDIAGLNWNLASRHLLGFYQARCTACDSAQPELVAFARANPTTAVWVIAPKQHALVNAKFSSVPSNLIVIPVDSAKAYSDYNVTGTPTHILVQNGKIRWRKEGFAPGVLQSIP
jgi:hypothetical protein